MSNPKLLYNKHSVNLLCTTCYGNLHYLTEEDKSRLKGRITLFCSECGRKHFGDVQLVDQWALDVKEGRAERQVKPPPPPEPEPEETPSDELQPGVDEPVDGPESADA